MSIDTESEVLFSRYCRSNGIPCRPILTRSQAAVRTPDYLVRMSQNFVAVEVKQLDESPFDRDFRDRLQKYGQAGGEGPPLDKRIREKIHRAVPQLRRLAATRRPALLVIYDNASFFKPGGLEIRLAMYGRDHVDISLAESPKGLVAILRHRFGAGQKVGPTFNTTLSAVALLSQVPEGTICLSVYHNRYARLPLDPAWLRNPATLHYRLGTRSGPGGLVEWEAI
jgi:hypothetical protein